MIFTVGHIKEFEKFEKIIVSTEIEQQFEENIVVQTLDSFSVVQSIKRPSKIICVGVWPQECEYNVLLALKTIIDVVDALIIAESFEQAAVIVSKILSTTISVKIKNQQQPNSPLENIINLTCKDRKILSCYYAASSFMASPRNLIKNLYQMTITDSSKKDTHKSCALSLILQKSVFKLPELKCFLGGKIFHSPFYVSILVNNCKDNDWAICIANSSCISKRLRQLLQKTSNLLRVNAYIHKYEKLGIKQEDFVESFKRLYNGIFDLTLVLMQYEN